jgi:hypothetical protein
MDKLDIQNELLEIRPAKTSRADGGFCQIVQGSAKAQAEESS